MASKIPLVVAWTLMNASFAAVVQLSSKAEVSLIRRQEKSKVETIDNDVAEVPEEEPEGMKAKIKDLEAENAKLKAENAKLKEQLEEAVSEGDTDDEDIALSEEGDTNDEDIPKSEGGDDRRRRRRREAMNDTDGRRRRRRQSRGR